MPTASKLSVEKGTASSPDQFQRARLRLTLRYASLLAIILTISCAITYLGFSQRIERPDGTYRQGFQDTDHDSPQQEENELLYVLIIANSTLLIIASAFSYWLADATLAPVRESYERQQRFLGDASHELRTPLAILKANTENELFAQKKSGKAGQELTANLEEIERMSTLVSDLLTLSRLDEGEGIGVATVDVQYVTQQVVERFQSFAKQREITLTYEDRLPNAVNIRANRELVARALSNVVKNAIAYNKEKGSVAVTVLVRQGRVEIQVADTGNGISKEDLPHVFDRFYRADKNRSRQVGGSGLGLSIVRSIVERYAGEARITTVPGKSTTVTLIFPEYRSK